MYRLRALNTIKRLVNVLTGVNGNEILKNRHCGMLVRSEREWKKQIKKIKIDKPSTGFYWLV